MTLQLANQDEEDNPVPVTFRKEEAIERLAEASARVRLSNKVTKEDADIAPGLVKDSMKQVGVDPESGEFDADVGETGQSKSQRDRRKEILDLISEHERVTLEELDSLSEVAREMLKHEVEELLNQGKIYNSGDGLAST